MVDPDAVDLWIEGTAFGCRKTVRGSDWHYVDFRGVNLADLGAAIATFKANDLAVRKEREAVGVGRAVAQALGRAAE